MFEYNFVKVSIWIQSLSQNKTKISKQQIMGIKLCKNVKTHQDLYN